MDVDETESTPASPDPEEFEEAASPSQMEDEAMSEGGYSYDDLGLQSSRDVPMETDVGEQQQRSAECSPESDSGDDQSGPGSPGEQGSDQASDQYSNGPTNSEPRSRNSSEGDESGSESGPGSWSPGRSEGHPPDGAEEQVPEEGLHNQARENKESEHEAKDLSDEDGESSVDAGTKDDLHEDIEKSEHAEHVTPDEAGKNKTSKEDSRVGSGTVHKKSTEKPNNRTKTEVDMQVNVQPSCSTLRNGDGEEEKEDSLNMSKSSLHDDHGELDYDEEIHEESGENMNKKISGKDEVKEVPATEGSKDDDEDGERKTDEEDDGELDDEDDCEEGEIKEPGNRRPFVRPLCRFYNRGNCTWGSSCRFLHPGVNDKGNYSLIERPAPPGIHSRLGPARPGTQWGAAVDRGAVVEPELPPPPEDPPAESSWERGLRHAKELMKRANKRKETETNFEEKRLTLSLEDEKEYNKENDRGRFVKDPYYDNVYEEEDEYYSKAWVNSTVAPPPANQNWHGGHYENFEVRWTREPEFGAPFRGPPPVPERERLRERHHRERRFSPESERIRTTVHPQSAVLPPMDRHMSPETERIRYEKRREERNERFEKFDKYEKYDKYDRPPVYDRPLPYVREERPERMNRSERDDRGDREDRIDRLERLERMERLERLERSERPERQEEPLPVTKMRGDEWHDPWRRAGHQSKISKAPSPKRRRSTSRSRSRGRRRYRSFSRGSRGSSSSSYSSSSYTSRSRSRSSSYSSYSSRSSRSSSSSRTRSRTPSKARPLLGPQNNHKERRPVIAVKPGEAPKSTVTVKPGLRGGPPGGRSGPVGSPHNPRGAPAPRGGPRGGPGGGPPRPGPQRSPDKKKPPGAPPGHLLVPGPPPGPKGGAPPAVKPGPPQDRGRPRERELPARAMPKRRSYSASSSGSSSRSRSFSSSSSRSRSGSASSVSSLSSSSSSSSSGSADSEHLYRDIASGHSSAGSPTARNTGPKKDSPRKKVTKPKEAGPQAGPGAKVERKRPGEKREARGPPGRDPPPGVGDGRQRDAERDVERDKRPFQGGRGMNEDMGRQRRGADLGPAGRGNLGRGPPAPTRVGRSDPPRPSGSENVGRGARSGGPAGRHHPRAEGVGRGIKEEHIGRMEYDEQEAMHLKSSMSQAPIKTAKDPLKMSGQKSNIKLTLISKSSDKASAGSRKRPAPDAPGAPSNKRPAMSAPPAKPAPLKEMKAGQKVAPSVRQPEKPVVKPVVPKAKPEVSKPVAGAVPVVVAPKRPEPVAKPIIPTPVVPPTAPKPAGPAPSAKASKSTSSRREELLKQLKVVEDAIARKRAKVQ